MPHFHLSLQAGDDMILKRMKRRHSRAEAVATIERIKTGSPRCDDRRRPDRRLSDRNRGHGTEHLKLLDDCDIIAAHVFPFSPRPNTPAERMPQLAREVVKARAARLRAAASERRSRWLDGLIGSTLPMLIENNGKGHSDNFAPVAIAGATRGQTGMARITGRDGDHLTAVWA